MLNGVKCQWRGNDCAAATRCPGQFVRQRRAFTGEATTPVERCGACGSIRNGEAGSGCPFPPAPDRVVKALSPWHRAPIAGGARNTPLFQMIGEEPAGADFRLDALFRLRGLHAAWRPTAARSSAVAVGVGADRCRGASAPHLVPGERTRRSVDSVYVELPRRQSTASCAFPCPSRQVPDAASRSLRDRACAPAADAACGAPGAW